jgi:hypothetical protein
VLTCWCAGAALPVPLPQSLSLSLSLSPSPHPPCCSLLHVILAEDACVRVHLNPALTPVLLPSPRRCTADWSATHLCCLHRVLRWLLVREHRRERHNQGGAHALRAVGFFLRSLPSTHAPRTLFSVPVTRPRNTWRARARLSYSVHVDNAVNKCSHASAGDGTLPCFHDPILRRTSPCQEMCTQQEKIERLFLGFFDF